MPQVRIFYKSGNSIDVSCEDFSVEKNSGILRSINWTEAQPRPLLAGANDIEAIYVLSE